MPMQKTPPAANPDAYVAALDGWQRAQVVKLRKAVRGAAELEEVVKWGHLVYFSDGPVLLIRAEPARVLFGFWRGKRLGAIEPRLKPGGQYELATMELREDTVISPAKASELVREAVALNRSLGNPAVPAKKTAAGKALAKKPAAKKTTTKSKTP
ncbi:DUF1801 domain-containing protein [Solimonas fluminis]|nr:DUF1801 domain-containing protein [Solimonas fluminis]